MNTAERPNKNTRVTRPKRVPMHDPRDIFGLHGALDTNRYWYYWAVDKGEDGSRIQRMRLAGYEFVAVSELPDGIVGSPQIYKSRNYGSIVRVAANKTGDFHYLMKLPMELRREDEMERHENLLRIDEEMKRHQPGQYGEVRIESTLSR